MEMREKERERRPGESLLDDTQIQSETAVTGVYAVVCRRVGGWCTPWMEHEGVQKKKKKKHARRTFGGGSISREQLGCVNVIVFFALGVIPHNLRVLQQGGNDARVCQRE